MGRKKRSLDEAKTDMTPMIDVVFQLIIFFVVTIKPMEIISRLDVFRPAPDLAAKPEEKPELVRLSVLPGNKFMLNQLEMGLPTLERNLKNMAARSKTQLILVQCSEQSSHANLVALLDLCMKVGLQRLSVVTIPPGKR
jgi:biopolymer transport protein ExbD